MTKKKWINLIVILFAFFGFVYIMSTIPFCSDDWAWGASVGAQRLASHFRGYNGRYLGNLLILLLTKSNFIKTIGMAVVSFSVIYLIYKYIGDGKLFYFLFALPYTICTPPPFCRFPDLKHNFTCQNRRSVLKYNLYLFFRYII